MGDPLRLWRQVTAERGVALYMHYSGVWDSEAIRRHPDWGVVNADGKTNDKATSRFGPYADKLLIPQLRELAGDYGVDGVWVDGDCWASVPDYSEAALKAFRQATGIAGRAAQTWRPALVRVPPIPSRGISPIPAPLHRRGEEDEPRFPVVQQLGLHRSHARAGQRAVGLSSRATTPRMTASTPPACPGGI